MPFNNGEFENLILAIQKENSDSNFIKNRVDDSNISDDVQTIYRFQDSLYQPKSIYHICDL